MFKKSFEKKVKQGLSSLDNEQCVHFAWRCAVRALPLLGSGGSFNFWDEKNRQNNIYAVLNALDVAYSNDAYNNDEDAAYSAVSVATNAAASAASAASVATNAANANAKAATKTAFNGVAAANAAANAAYAAYAATYANAKTVAKAAVNTAVNAAASKEVAINLNETILQDLNNMLNKVEVGRASLQYGVIWDNFQKALENEGCAYWGQLYKNIFDSGFNLDREALERRINVPKEIRRQGAAAVANYLEELKKELPILTKPALLFWVIRGSEKPALQED